MSAETARDFLTLLSNDSAVRDQLYTTQPETVHDLLLFARQKTGYLFTEFDLRAALETFDDPALVGELRETYRL
jgi:hypothetical protein